MSKLYEKLIRPALFNLPPETAHEFGVEALKLGLNSKFVQDLAAKRFACESFGEIERFGLKFKNPLGIAAGFDKKRCRRQSTLRARIRVCRSRHGDV